MKGEREITTLYHGTQNETLALHLGLCFTPDFDAAARYAGRWGYVFEVELDTENLEMLEIEGYDREENEAPGDSAESIAELAKVADAVKFDNEDECQQWHYTTRIVTQKGLDAICDIKKLWSSGEEYTEEDEEN